MTLIEKEPIMKFIQDGLNNKHYGYVGVEIITEVEFAPTFEYDGEGYWINKGEDRQCSKCKGYVTGWHPLADCTFPRCPWCGAHMRRKKEKGLDQCCLFCKSSMSSDLADGKQILICRNKAGLEGEDIFVDEDDFCENYN